MLLLLTWMRPAAPLFLHVFHSRGDVCIVTASARMMACSFSVWFLFVPQNSTQSRSFIFICFTNVTDRIKILNRYNTGIVVCG